MLTGQPRCLNLFLHVFVGVFFFFIPLSHAQTLTENAALGFGEFALRDNDAGHVMRITTGGAIIEDPEFIRIVDGQRGDYSIGGCPPVTGVAVTVTDGTLTLADLGAGEAFTLNNYTHNAPVTDGAGNATLYIGGRLTTSGSSTMYTDGQHRDVITVTIMC